MEETILRALLVLAEMYKTHKAGGEVSDEKLDLAHRLAEQAEDDLLDTP